MRTLLLQCAITWGYALIRRARLASSGSSSALRSRYTRLRSSTDVST